MHLSWAVFSEGATDQAYFGVLLPRIMQEILLEEGLREIEVPAEPALPLGRYGRAVNDVAKEICEARDAFHLLFIHADTGGRALARGVAARSISYCEAANRLCGWERERCVIVTPRPEMEAWALGDPQAVADAFGYRGAVDNLKLPPNADAAEKITDPKSVLEAAYRIVVGRRALRSAALALPAIAKNQRLSELRRSSSFSSFEEALRAALRSLGCIRPA